MSPGWTTPFQLIIMQRMSNELQPEIRLICEARTRDTAINLANLFGRYRIRYITYYTPRHNPRLIVFKFDFEEESALRMGWGLKGDSS